jgi:hypothetical protein
MSLLFFRNTHTGPNHDQYREDLLKSVNPVHDARTPAAGAAQGLFLLHFLDHVEGRTFEQLVEQVREYEAQFHSDPMQIQDILIELLDSINETVIVVKEKPLTEEEQGIIFCEILRDITERA